jgi:hypothetical protein
LLPRIQDFNIRYIQEKDYPYILESTRKIVSIILPNKPFDEDKIEAIFQQALLNDTHTTLVLVDSEDNAKGFVLVGLDELYFHSTKVAICLAIWVELSCRAHSLDMIRAVHSWAKFKKAEAVTLSSFNNLSPARMDKVLTYLKYEAKEIVYWKDL